MTSQPVTQVEKSKVDKVKARWKDEYKQLFIELALEEVEKGNRPTTNFNKVGYENIIKAFNEKTHENFEQSQFKNLYGSMRISWREWQALGKLTGLEWDKKLVHINLMKNIGMRM